DHAPAVAGGPRVGADDAVGADQGLLRVLHARVRAVLVTADEHGAAARVARGVDDAVADNADAHAERLDGSALAGAAFRLDGSIDEVRAALRLQRDVAAAGSVGGGHAARVEGEVLGGDEADLALRPHHRAVRLDDSAVAHQRAEHADPSGVSEQLADVERPLAVGGDVYGDEGRALGHQLDGLARGEDDVPLRRADDARVLHVRADEEYAAARARGARVDRAGVRHRAGAGRLRESHLPGKEVGVREVEARSDESRNVDATGLADHDPALVEQEDAAV